jgi:hypothetical protein
LCWGCSPAGAWALTWNPTTPSGAGQAREPAPAGSGPSDQASSAPVPAAGPARTGTAAILADERRTLIHLVKIDRDLAVPFPDEVVASDGTGKDALFVLLPTGVNYLIQSGARRG